MTDTFTLSLTMTPITCCHAGCGLVFGVPKWWESGRREDHTWWFCPNGHRQYFSAKSDTEKLQDQLKTEKQRVQYWQAEELRERRRADMERRRAAAARGQVTKVKKRVGNGVCPCCTRTFQNLARHMASQHPDYSTDAACI